MLRATTISLPYFNVGEIAQHSYIFPTRGVSPKSLSDYSLSGSKSLASSNADRKGIWGRSPESARLTLLKQPLIHQAVRDASTDNPFISEMLEAAIEGDLRNAEAYRVDRALAECSDITDNTLFGRIEENIVRRLEEKKARGDDSPLRILTIGPGWGCMEADLMKSSFASDVEIDAFTLTDAVPPENRGAFSAIHIGDLETHHLPRGYDLIISIFGSFHVRNQDRVFGQILESLNQDGEAVYNYAIAAEGCDQVQEFDTPIVCEYLRDHWGVDYYENRLLAGLNVSHGCDPFAYIHKRRGGMSAEALFSGLRENAERFADNRDYIQRYRVEDRGPYIRADKDYPANIKKMIRAVAHERGEAITIDLEDDDEFNNIEVECVKWLLAGFSLRRIIEDKVWGSVIRLRRR